MADDHLRPQHAQRLQPFDRRLAVAAGDLVELDHALRRMQLHSDAALGRRVIAVADQIGGAGVDLRRAQHAGNAARRVLRSIIDHIERALHGLLAGGLVPLILHRMAVLRGPGGGTVHRAQHRAHAGRGHIVGPALTRAGQVGDGGDAAFQQLAHRHHTGGAGRIRVEPEHRHEFIQRGLAEARAAQLLQQALVAGLRGRVGMDVDEAWHQHQAAPVDLPVGGAGIALADEAELVALEGDVRPFQIGMAARRLVPGNHVIGVADHNRLHNPSIPV